MKNVKPYSPKINKHGEVFETEEENIDKNKKTDEKDTRFYCWMDFQSKYQTANLDLYYLGFEPFKKVSGISGVRPGHTKLEETVFGCEDSIRYILNFINQQDFSFDGFICFS